MNKRGYRAAGRSAALALLTLAMLVVPAFSALAASDSKSDGSEPINKVSIKIKSELEPGSRLPDIEIGDADISDGGIRVTAGNKKYTLVDAEWVDKSSEALKVAEEPKMKVTLEPTDVSEDYFQASYKESKVSISGGSFVSARRDGDNLVVTLLVKGVKGEFEAPEEAWWNENNLGEGRWEKPENGTGRYEIELERDGRTLFEETGLTSVQYNFYPYMTKAGTYTFRVRSIAKTATEKKYGEESEWVESGELVITERYVSDGKGQQANAVLHGSVEKIGWDETESGWIYRYPNGDICRGGWSEIDGYWYYFNMDGVMQTGWLDVSGYRYLLHSTGQMATGWVELDNKWYYFRPQSEDGKPAGSMTEPGWQLINPFYYYFNQDGTMYTGWLNLNGKWYYLNTVENSMEGVMFTGWILRDGKTYFADGNGVRVSGWFEIDGNMHYFYPDTGEMARNADIDGFYVDSDGIWR